ncbi:Protein required for ethanol metabolism [Basidiobolus ranarum]|uniref:Protein required for ethanol metabolism n=1 Tax=Basidiobolus ranarum TaxID=34480 RepID=A0ABR2WL11_9FUNG
MSKLLKPCTRAFTWYSRNLERRPFLVKSVSTATIVALGDVACQKLVEKKPQLDRARTLRMMIHGGLIMGPALSFWHPFLERLVRVRNPQLALLCRVAIDQTVYAPFIVGVFFISQGVLSGCSLHEVQERLRAGYPTALLNNWKVWPISNLIIFYLLPLHYRFLLGNVVSLGWNTYLSFLNQKVTFLTTNTPTIPILLKN